jgi:DNA-binding SARP family transcriptional activator
VVVLIVGLLTIEWFALTLRRYEGHLAVGWQLFAGRLQGHTGAMTTADVRLLGRFAVLTGGGPVPTSAFGGRKTRQLLQVLAVHHDRHVSHDALAEALWPHAPPADPAANLGVLVNRARRALGDPTFITTGPRGYALTGCRVDTDRFADDVAAARKEAADRRWRSALTAYRRALDLWVGEPLAEEQDAPWAQEFRRHMLAVYQAALEEAADAATRLGEGTLAVQYAELAVLAAPLREVASVRLARAQETCGDQAAAIATVHTLRHRLAEELGVDPSPEVQHLLSELLARPGAHPTGARRRAPSGRSGSTRPRRCCRCWAATPSWTPRAQPWTPRVVSSRSLRRRGRASRASSRT